METERIVGIVEVDFVKLIKALSGKGRLEIRIEGWPGWQKMHDRVPLVFCYG